jgi:hypothetical protein
MMKLKRELLLFANNGPNSFFALFTPFLPDKNIRKTTMASQPQPRHENGEKDGWLLRYEEKERREETMTSM